MTWNMCKKCTSEWIAVAESFFWDKYLKLNEIWVIYVFSSTEALNI